MLLLVGLLASRGVSAEQLLAGTGVTHEQLLKEGAHITPIEMWAITARSRQLTNDPTLSYAFGFEMKPTAHGLLGYAMMTCATFGASIRLLERFLRLRVRVAQLSLSMNDELAVLTLTHELVLPDPDLRRWVIEVITTAMVRGGEMLLGERPPMEMWLDYPEPPYFERVRDQLPPVRFAMPRIELRFPRSYLDRPLMMADPVASNEAVKRLERELSLLDEQDVSLLARVRELLSQEGDELPSLSSCAKRLAMSERTLKRKLQRAGTSYQKLLDDTRLVRATTLLESSDAPVEKVAAMLGYNDPANFTRAFRRWTGQSPRAYRLSRRA